MFTHFDRSVFLTGVLSPPVIINSSGLLKTINYSVGMNQDININNLYIQGGPGKSVASFQKKIISGNIEFFLRINESNILESAVTTLLSSGQDYTSSVTMTTALMPYNDGITAETSPFISSTNSFVFDTCVIEKTTISAKKDGSVKVMIQVLGQTDLPNTSVIPLPPDDSNLYRNLSLYDCLFTRSGSQMENAVEIEITITKELDQRYFLMVYGAPDRFDRPYSTGVKSVAVSFVIKEHITSLEDIFTFSFGGDLENINFVGNIGPISFNIPNAILDISSQNLDGDIIQRTTKGFYRLAPNTPNNPSFVFSL